MFERTQQMIANFLAGDTHAHVMATKQKMALEQLIAGNAECVIARIACAFVRS